MLAIAGHEGVALPLKQAALFSLKDVVNKTWATDFEAYESQYAGVLDDPTKQQIREGLLHLSVFSGQEPKVMSAASLIVSKIANHDYPEEWPTLLNNILAALPTKEDSQLHGALKVLSDLMDDGLTDEQFQEPAPRIFRDLRNIVADESRPGFRRAQAIQIFNSSIDFLEQIQIDHGSSVLSFAQGAMDTWLPLFATILETPLSDGAHIEGPDKLARDGLIAMKVQIYKTLTKLRVMLAVLVTPHSTGLFEVTWKSLVSTQNLYTQLYLVDEQPMRQETNDHLPFSLDYLIIDQIDFLGAILRDQEPFVRLKKNAKTSPSTDTSAEDLRWLRELTSILMHYAQITLSEEATFEMDVNLWLCDEASITADYTARSTSGDMVNKLASHLREIAIEQLFQTIAQTQEATSESSVFGCAVIVTAMLTASTDGEDPRPSCSSPAICSALLQRWSDQFRSIWLRLPRCGFLSRNYGL